MGCFVESSSGSACSSLQSDEGNRESGRRAGVVSIVPRIDDLLCHPPEISELCPLARKSMTSCASWVRADLLSMCCAVSDMCLPTQPLIVDREGWRTRRRDEASGLGLLSPLRQKVRSNRQSHFGVFGHFFSNDQRLPLFGRHGCWVSTFLTNGGFSHAGAHLPRNPSGARNR